MVISIDKKPLQDILDEGLDPFFKAICEAAKQEPDRYTFDKTGDRDPLDWYIQKRLNWQASQHSIAWVFTEHHGGLLMPSPFVMFLGRYRSHFGERDHDPTVGEVAAWLESERAQGALDYDRRERVKSYVARHYFMQHKSTVGADEIAEALKLTLGQIIAIITKLVLLRDLKQDGQKDGTIPLVRPFLEEDK